MPDGLSAITVHLRRDANAYASYLLDMASGNAEPGQGGREDRRRQSRAPVVRRRMCDAAGRCSVCPARLRDIPPPATQTTGVDEPCAWQLHVRRARGCYALAPPPQLRPGSACPVGESPGYAQVVDSCNHVPLEPEVAHHPVCPIMPRQIRSLVSEYRTL